MPGLLRPHQDRLQACMTPLYAGEEVQHWPWWHFFLHWPNHFDYNPIDPIYDEGMGLYNGMFNASIDLVHILILYQYDDISTVNCPPNTTSFDPAVHKSLLTSQNCVQSSTSSSSAEISALSAVSTLFTLVASFMCPGNALPVPSTPGPKLHN